MRTVTCELCGLSFQSAWTNQQAVEQHVDAFGRPPDQDAAIVCDSCYDKAMDLFYQNQAKN